MARRDRGALLSWTLLGAGLLLAGVVVAVLLLRSPAPQPKAPTTVAAPTAPPPTTTTAPPSPPAPARIAAVTPFSVTVAWHTDALSTDRVALARGSGPPTLWSEPVGPALEHATTVRGLTLDTDYRATVAGHELSFHTPTAPGSMVAATSGGAITLDGSPYFPLMVWGECPGAYGNEILAGINLVAQNPCGGTNAQVDALAGHALSAGIAGDAEASNPALIGWFFPDEADIHGLTARTLPEVPESSVAGRVSFLTLSNHVYSRAAPTQFGRAIYPGLIAKADVVGFDLYPLQSWCLKTQIDDVYTSQRELVARAGGKPTFQWIESGQMDCGTRGGVVTPAVVRAESLLAVAGGAHGLGFFPGEWTAQNTVAVSSVTSAINAVAPALLTPQLAASADAPLRVAAFALNGAVYVVAVNPTRGAVSATLRVPGLRGRALQPLGGGPALQSVGDTARGRFPPLGAAVYVAAPA